MTAAPIGQGWLTLYVVYRWPADYPDKIVVRRNFVGAGNWKVEPVPAVFDTLDQARRAMPPGTVNIGRMGADDPVIAEVWV